MWTTLECAIFFADHMEERFAYSNQSVGVINDCSLTYRFSLRFQIVQKNITATTFNFFSFFIEDKKTNIYISRNELSKRNKT